MFEPFWKRTTACRLAGVDALLIIAELALLSKFSFVISSAHFRCCFTVRRYGNWDVVGGGGEMAKQREIFLFKANFQSEYFSAENVFTFRQIKFNMNNKSRLVNRHETLHRCAYSSTTYLHGFWRCALATVAPIVLCCNQGWSSVRSCHLKWLSLGEVCHDRENGIYYLENHRRRHHRPRCYDCWLRPRPTSPGRRSDNSCGCYFSRMLMHQPTVVHPIVLYCN